MCFSFSAIFNFSEDFNGLDAGSHILQDHTTHIMWDLRSDIRECSPIHGCRLHCYLAEQRQRKIFGNHPTLTLRTLCKLREIHDCSRALDSCARKHAVSRYLCEQREDVCTGGKITFNASKFTSTMRNFCWYLSNRCNAS